MILLKRIGRYIELRWEGGTGIKELLLVCTPMHPTITCTRVLFHGMSFVQVCNNDWVVWWAVSGAGGRCVHHHVWT